ncbi:peptidyl-prolyl cis-trans isomerase [Bifidobacterium pseudolongum subsp. globosum]|nr:peptidyl-prolyl cis-trans isomerase [Bifidobacterium pseudolongum subsp. globosum]
MMTTPENPYNGNPYTPGTGQPADETQQFGQPAQQPYGAPQAEPTQAMPDYGQMQPNPYAAPEQPMQSFDYSQQGQQPYGGQIPPQEPMVGYGAQQNNDKWNGLVIAGFVCAFLVPIVGLILSIIGMVQINKNGGKSKGMAIAGIIVSVVVMVLNGLLVFSMLNAANSVVQTALTTSQSPSATSSSPSTTDPDIDDLDTDLDDLDDDLDDLDNDVDTLPEGTTLEDLMSNSTFKEQFEQQVTKGLPDGMDMKVSAKGNTLIFDATVNKPLTDDQVEQLRSMAETDIATSMEGVAGQLNSTLNTDDAVVHLTMKLADGQTIVDEDYTE